MHRLSTIARQITPSATRRTTLAMAPAAGISSEARVFARETSTGAPSVWLEEQDHIATISLYRPHARNAVDRATAEGLASAFRHFDSDSSLHVAVLFGAGGTFCAGADLKAVYSKDPSRMNRIDTAGDGPMGPTRMVLSKPVVAACTGYAVAGGLELAIWCDLRVASKDTVFGVFCRRFGVPLIDGGTVRLPRLIGQSRAADLILTGRPVQGEEAHAMGLVNRLVETPEDVLKAAQGLAREIASFPQVCVRRDRLSALEQWGMSEEQAMANEFAHGLVSLATNTADGAKKFADGAGRGGKF